jgi:pyruvate dehydrogenase E2 component (dihydrolipoamide acetyltransferase)
MVTQFTFPDVGEGITEGEIVAWLVKEGDTVKEDQNIVKVETDKAVVDLPAPASGKIIKIYKKQGETVNVGEVLVDIGSEGEKAMPKVEKAPKPEPKKVPKPVTKKSQSVIGELEEAEEEAPKPVTKKSQSVVGELEEAEDTPKPVTKKVAPSKGVKVMPAVRKLAQELNIDLSTIKGTGPKGRILAKDIKSSKRSLQKVSHTKTSEVTIKKKYDMWGYVDRIPLKGMRKTIAQHMTQQASIPMVTHTDEIDVTKLYYLRKKEKKKAPEGVNLTYLPFIMKAIIVASKKYPLVNSTLAEEEIIVKKYHSFGIAVATKEGLIVPVVKRAETKTLFQLAEEIQNLAERGRKRELDIMDLKGGSFTITNVGSIGGLFATPILNTGEASILALGRIYDKPVVVGNRVKRITSRKVLPVSLTFDHRIYDGATAALFMNMVKEFLEEPEFLMMDLF